VKRQLLTLLLVVLIIPATVVGYSFWVDWRYIEPCQKVTRGDSEEHVLASLGRPHRAVIERSDKASWESEHKIDWYDAESVKQFRYVPFSITAEEYGIGFDSSGHACPNSASRHRERSNQALQPTCWPALCIRCR